jgi:regulator of replication initiation timing
MEGTNEIHTQVARLEEQVKGFKEQMQRMEEYNAKALKIQADEYGRRLDELNHSHEQAIEVRSSYLPRETFDRYIEGTEKRIKTLEAFNASLIGKMWLPMLMISTAAAALVGIAIKKFGGTP